jgi:hypothetical protein
MSGVAEAFPEPTTVMDGTRGLVSSAQAGAKAAAAKRPSRGRRAVLMAILLQVEWIVDVYLGARLSRFRLAKPLPG